MLWSALSSVPSPGSRSRWVRSPEAPRMTRFTASDTTLLKSHARPGSTSVMSMPRAREAGSVIEGKGTGAPPKWRGPGTSLRVVSGQALLGDVGEHMDVLGVDTHADRRATVRRKPRVDAVSYTHLRAHETDSYLVCRLLLEKKK